MATAKNLWFQILYVGVQAPVWRPEGNLLTELRSLGEEASTFIC